MMEFTKEEISLCKQVAEKDRNPIKYGEWYWSKSHNKILLALDYGFKINEQEFMGIFKIWTISDCLEFLIEKGYDKILNFMYFPDDKWTFVAESFVVEAPYHKVRGEGKTRLEACLKAVLAVLEEEKSNG